MIMDYYAGGDLYHLITEGGPLRPSLARKLFMQLISGPPRDPSSIFFSSLVFSSPLLSSFHFSSPSFLLNIVFSLVFV